MIQISQIELLPMRTINGLTFFANFLINNNFYIGNVAVFSKKDGSGFRCVYPTKRLKNGSEIPLFYPVNYDVGQQIDEAISQKAIELLSPVENEDYA